MLDQVMLKVSQVLVSFGIHQRCSLYSHRCHTASLVDLKANPMQCQTSRPASAFELNQQLCL